MTDKDSLWEDPTPPEMFAPTKEAVQDIVQKASKPSFLPRGNMRPVAAVAMLAGLIVLSSFGIRFLTGTLGNTAMSSEEALLRRHARQEAQVPQATRTPTGSTHAVLVGSPIPQATVMPSATKGDYLSLPELTSQSDAVVAGCFGAEGFTVEQVLKGEAGDILALPGGQSMRGWALVLLVQDEKGNWEYAQEPAVFRLDQELLRARSYLGEPMNAYDAANTLMTLEELRTALLEQSEERP